MLMVDSPPSVSSSLTSSIVWSLGNGYLSLLVVCLYLLLATPHYSLTVTINNYGQLMAILIVPRGHI